METIQVENRLSGSPIFLQPPPFPRPPTLLLGEKNFPLVLASGLFAGMVGAFTSTPSDVIKTRLQVNPHVMNTEEVQKRTVFYVS